MTIAGTTRGTLSRRSVAVLALALALVRSPAWGQGGHPASSGSPLTTSRMDLQRRLQRLDSLARFADDGALREQARREAELVWQRLAAGDFQPGDRVLLLVEGDSLLSDTLTVRQGPVLELPGIGPVPLAGVLRSELERYLADTLAVYLRDPGISARALLSLWVVGEVERPGFYAVPSDATLPHVLMLAGGLTREAKVNGLRVERDSQRVWEGERLQRVLTQGHTVDELSLRRGDRIVVPRGQRWDADMTLRVLSFAIALPVAIFSLTRIF